MSFTPMSKESMQKLKAEEDEKNRNKKIKEIISNIYNCAINTAKGTSNTSFHHEIPMNKYDNSLDIFYINNKNEIVKILQELFTDCSVSFSMLSRGNDGKMYDISKMDEKVIPFINRQFDKSYIVIDWS
jgi:hypothetical protein